MARNKGGKRFKMRNITKTISSTNASIVVRYLNNEGLQEKTFDFVGCKSERAAKVRVRKELGTNNFMVVSCEIQRGTDEKRLTIDADTFFTNSLPCVDGVTYGHDTITAQFTTSVYTVYTMTETLLVSIIGKTTPNKARKTIAEQLKDENILVNETPAYETERRWMAVAAFEMLAREC